MANKRTLCPLCAGHGYRMIRHTNPKLEGKEPLEKQFCVTCNGTGYIEVQETNAERIRSMDDAQLADMIFKLDIGDCFCQNKKKCQETLDNDQEIPESLCKVCILEWLHKPAEETKHPAWIYDEKQFSGLLEEE